MITKFRFLFLELIFSIISCKQRQKNLMNKYAFDFRAKLNALKKSEKYLDFNRVKFISGGWNIGFVIDNKYVFKVRKFNDSHMNMDKIKSEQRITDIFNKNLSVQIPKIKIIKSDDFIFIRYDYIPGVNLNTISGKKIKKYNKHLSKQIAQFIFEMQSINSNIYHNDLCNNILVNKKTMDITGIIDWEYAGPGTLENEFKNLVIFKKKINNAGIKKLTINYFNKLNKKSA